MKKLDKVALFKNVGSKWFAVNIFVGILLSDRLKESDKPHKMTNEDRNLVATSPGLASSTPEPL